MKKHMGNMPKNLERRQKTGLFLWPKSGVGKNGHLTFLG